MNSLKGKRKKTIQVCSALQVQCQTSGYQCETDDLIFREFAV